MSHSLLHLSEPLRIKLFWIWEVLRVHVYAENRNKNGCALLDNYIRVWDFVPLRAYSVQNRHRWIFPQRLCNKKELLFSGRTGHRE